MKTIYISDLDGTLLNSDKIITKESTEKINSAIANGAIFTIATARSYVSAMDMIKDLNINAPMVLMNGVFVYDRQNDKYLKYESLTEKSINHILDLLDRHGEKARMYAFDGRKMIVYSLKEGYRYTFPEDVESEYRKMVATDSLRKHMNDYPVVSILLIDQKNKLQPVYDDLKNNPELYCCLYEDVYNPSVFWLEIYDSHVNKAAAVDFVKNSVGADKMVTFGDNINDIGMLDESDVGVCVQNALDEVKQHSDVILPDTNNEDAVAKYMDNIYGGR